jgi:hypothetical protein
MFQIYSPVSIVSGQVSGDGRRICLAQVTIVKRASASVAKTASAVVIGLCSEI